MSLYIAEKTAKGKELIPVETKLLEMRKIMISGEIDSEMADRITAELIWLVAQDPKAPIDLLINSPGGEVSAGLAIYDMIQGCAAPVRTYCVGTAASMAAVIFSGGSHGRYIIPHGQVMIHEPLLGSKIGGNCSSVRSISDSLLKTKTTLNEILARHTGKTVEEIDEASSYDHYFGAQESIDFGLCDGIVTHL